MEVLLIGGGYFASWIVSARIIGKWCYKNGDDAAGAIFDGLFVGFFWPLFWSGIAIVSGVRKVCRFKLLARSAVKAVHAVHWLILGERTTAKQSQKAVPASNRPWEQ